MCLPMISSGLERDTIFCEIIFGILGTIFCFNLFQTLRACRDHPNFCYQHGKLYR